MVTCAWMRHSFFLPQCSVQHPPGSPAPLLSIVPPKQTNKHATSRQFPIWGKMNSLWDFLKFSPAPVLFFLPGFYSCHRTKTTTCLFSSPSIAKCPNHLNFWELFTNHHFCWFLYCFVFFPSREISLSKKKKVSSRLKETQKPTLFSGTPPKQTEKLC